MKSIANWLLLPLFLLMLVGTSVADINGPTQVILGVSTGDVVFTNNGGNNVTFGFTEDCGQGGNNCLSGFAYYGANVGNYEMWISGGIPSLGAPTNNVYPVNLNGASINFASTIGSLFLNGTVDNLVLNGGTQTPTFTGSLEISSTNIPGYGGKSEMDFTINLDGNSSIEDVYSGKVHSTQGYLSSGQVPPSSTVPEPGSFVLLGSGVLALGTLMRRKLGL